MKDSLAANWFVWIFSLSLSFVPTAVHKVESGKGYLYNNKVNGLVANEGQDSSSQVNLEVKIGGRNKQVEYEMEKDSGGYNKYCPSCICVRKSHFRQLVHKASEGQCNKHHEDKDDICDYTF